MKLTNICILFLIISLSACSGTKKSATSDKTSSKSSKNTATQPVAVASDKITWLSVEEVAKRMKKQPRKVLVDVYTDWCGWCKRMDNVTFSNPEVINYVNKNFYAVKLNAENPSPITLNGKEYKFVSSGSRGYHSLAAYLLNNQMGYPSLAFLDEKMQPIQAFAGFKDPKGMDVNMRFIAENHYKTNSWRNFATENGLQ